MAKINLDGGSSTATMWHGKKVPLCKQCAFSALWAYRTTSSTSVEVDLFPRMLKTYSPLGHFVIRISGRNMEGMVKELGLLKL